MRRLRNKLLLVAGVAALAAGIPAFGPALGQDRPESILPPGFGDPAEPAPKAKQEPAEPKAAEPSAPAEPGNAAEPDAPVRVPSSAREDLPDVTDSAAEDLRELRPTRPTYTLDVPADLARPVDVVGVLDEANWGLGPNAFGTARGAFLASLMRELEAPLPSRWQSMLLRRALMSRIPAPAGVDPVDWVARRAALLLRMGEADAARSLVQSVDVVNYTPLMIQAGLDTALATGDPAALCPLVQPGRALGDQPVWRMADAICAALAGEAARASEAIDRVRGSRAVSGADLLLAEKVVGAGTDTRRAVSIEWDEVEQLTPWRLGLAAATGMTVPEPLLRGADLRMQAWYARAPMVPVAQRVEPAFAAAALGVFSNNALVELYSLAFDAENEDEVENTPYGRLRIAYTHGNEAERIRALRDLWDDGNGPVQRYGRKVLTARAAALIRPSEARAEDADELIAAMLSAGFDTDAARWTDVVAAADTDPLAAALLALGAPAKPGAAGDVVETFQAADESRDDRRTQMLVAGLAGLDRLTADEASSWASDLRMPIGRDDAWTRALDDAIRARQTGTVALLAAVGMQAGDWGRVPASHLYRITRALRLVGMEFEARMIAAEALTRL
ncbi:MAG TPA: hypothetical protein VEZ20_16275 [Allosphingosinicella sp.]|nr:hypothetical protein [Allosphingosinicella sp.]